MRLAIFAAVTLNKYKPKSRVFGEFFLVLREFNSFRFLESRLHVLSQKLAAKTQPTEPSHFKHLDCKTKTLPWTVDLFLVISQ